MYISTNVASRKNAYIQVKDLQAQECSVFA